MSWEVRTGRWSGALRAVTSPRFTATSAVPTFRAVHEAISQGLVRSCHDLSEGGLAVALAEMAIAGGLGARLALMPRIAPKNQVAAKHPVVSLFSETPTRFVLEIRPEDLDMNLIALFEGLWWGPIGEVVEEPRFRVMGAPNLPNLLIDAPLSALKEAWQAPLRW